MYPIELTSAGVAFKEIAEETLRSLYRGRDELGMISAANGERIIVCTGQTLSRGFIPKWLVSIRERLGEVGVSIIPDNLQECIRALIRGDCDFLLTYAHPYYTNAVG